MMDMAKPLPRRRRSAGPARAPTDAAPAGDPTVVAEAARPEPDGPAGCAGQDADSMVAVEDSRGGQHERGDPGMARAAEPSSPPPGSPAVAPSPPSAGDPHPHRDNGTFERRLALLMAGSALVVAVYAVAHRPSPTPAKVPQPMARAGSGLGTAQLAELSDELGLAQQQLALMLLESALARRLPFETELALAIVAVGKDEAMLGALDRLGPLAAAGVPTRRDLQEALPRLVAEVRTASRQPGLVGKATVLMRDVALGLGVGELPDGSVDRLLGEVEQAQKLGRLEAAAIQLRRLPAGMTRLVGPWLEGFAARELADRTMEELRSAVVRNALLKKTA